MRRRRRKSLSLTKIIILFVVCTLTFSVGYSLLAQQLSVEGKVNLLKEEEITCKEYVTDELMLTYDNKMLWHNAGLNYMQIDITLTNRTQEQLDDWKVMIKFISDIEISGSWAGNYDLTDKKVTITGLDWNKSLSPGAETQFGFQVSTPDEDIKISAIYLNGERAVPGESCSVSTDTTEPDDSTTDDSTTDDSKTDDSITDDSTTDDSTTDDSTTDDSTTDDSTTDESKTDDSITDDSTTDDSTTDDSTMDDSTTDDSPADDEDTTYDSILNNPTDNDEEDNSLLDVQFTKGSSWGSEGNYTIQYNVKITNNSDINMHPWSYQFEIPEGAKIVNAWNCNYINADGLVTISPTSSNENLLSGTSTEMGFQITSPTLDFELTKK